VDRDAGWPVERPFVIFVADLVILVFAVADPS
jgi:hypothetical protein